MAHDEDPLPACPKCDKAMRLDRVIPGVAGRPELHTYICRPCGEALTFSADEKD